MTRLIRARKLAEIARRTGRVRALLPATAAALASDLDRSDALTFNLYLALHAASDLSLHLVADLGLGVPAGPRDAYRILAEQGVLAPDLARRLASAVGLRNRIAHGYETADLERIFDLCQNDLAYLDTLAARAAAPPLDALP